MEYKHPFREVLNKEILPFVIKPGRYVGNELNSIHKAHSPDLLKIALCFPDMYEIGMSYIGMQILYGIINKRPDCLAERAFAVWPDMQDVLTKKGFPLFSLESATPLSEFDILGFHLTYEMTYTTAINILCLAGIPFNSRDRGESYPLILAGGPSALNPEPMADFIDAFFIGDAEEAIHEIIDSVIDARSRRLDRASSLLQLSQIPGVYVPRLYEAEYGSDGRYAGLKRLNPEAPDKIKVRSVPELKRDYYPDRPIVPFVEIIHDHLAIEIMRGCVRGCRFCQAGYQYRPRRQRPPAEAAAHVLDGISATGYEDVTLLSLSSTDYEHLVPLLAEISPRLSEQRIGLGLPSLRPETITSSILDLISSARKTGLTLAPEAGTERLRNILGKRISDDEIYSAFDIALAAGWQTFKLYFMIGVPDETDDDIEGICALLRRLSFMVREKKGRNINVALSPFNPKSHTPWQWERQRTKEELQRKIDKINSHTRKTNLSIKYRGLDLAFIEGVIGRGDRRLGKVIVKAWEKGARLDGWSEMFEAERWYGAFAQCGIDPDRYAAAIDEEAPLPWDHIDKGISKKFLVEENQKSKEAIPPASVFEGAKPNVKQQQEESGFGRRTKRTVGVAAASGTYKVRLRYSRGPEIRFLSHLDMIRALYRALRRAELPVAFSEGFHPHIKLSFGQPLPVGYTSEAEYLDLQLTRPFREEYMVRLRQALPPGIGLLAHKHYFANVASLSKQLNLARYRVPRLDGIEYDSEKLAWLARDKRLSVSRHRPQGETQIEAGQFIDEIGADEQGLIVDIWQTPEGHIKPEEILIFGLGIDAIMAKTIIIHRLDQFHKSGMRLVEPLELV